MNTRYGFKITFTAVGKLRTKYNVSEVMPLPLTTRDHVNSSKDAEGRHIEVLRSFATRQAAERARSYEEYARKIDAIPPDKRDEMMKTCLDYLRDIGLAKVNLQRMLGKSTIPRSPNGGNLDIYHATEGDRHADPRLLARVMILRDMLERLRNDIRSILPWGLTSKKNAEEMLLSTPDITGVKDWNASVVWMYEWQREAKRRHSMRMIAAVKEFREHSAHMRVGKADPDDE